MKLTLTSVAPGARPPLRLLGRMGLLLAILAFVGVIGRLSVQAAPRIELGAASGPANSTVELPLTFRSSSSIVAAQLDLQYGEPTLAGQAAALAQPTAGLSVISAAISSRVQRVLLFSRNAAPWPDTVQLSAPIAILSNALPGTVAVTIANVILSDAQGHSLAPEAAVAGTVNILSAAGVQFQSAEVTDTGEMRMVLNAPIGRNCLIQASPDLRQWLPVSTNVAIVGAIVFTDRLSARQLFYRALLLP